MTIEFLMKYIIRNEQRDEQNISVPIDAQTLNNITNDFNNFTNSYNTKNQHNGKISQNIYENSTTARHHRTGTYPNNTEVEFNIECSDNDIYSIIEAIKNFTSETNNKYNKNISFLPVREDSQASKSMIKLKTDISQILLQEIPNNIPENISLYIELGADLNVNDENGNTPIHLATIRGNKIFVETLLKHVTIKHIINKDKKTPLDIAKEHNHKEISKLLIDSGYVENYTIETIKEATIDIKEEEEKYTIKANSYLNYIFNIVCYSLFFTFFWFFFIDTTFVVFLNKKEELYTHLVLIPAYILITITIIILYMAYSKAQTIAHTLHHKRISLKMLEAKQYHYKNNNIDTDKVDNAIIDIIVVNPLDAINKQQNNKSDDETNIIKLASNFSDVISKLTEKIKP